MINKSSRKYIAVEGLNGVGKTTVCKLLMAKGYRVFFDPDPSFRIRPIMDLLDRPLNSWEEAVMYTSGSVVSQAKNLGVEGTYISDRSPISTYAAYPNLPRHLVDALCFGLIMPDAVIFMMADAHAIEDRLRSREINSSDLAEQLAANVVMLRGYQQYREIDDKTPWLDVDVTECDENGAYELVAAALEANFGRH